MRKSCIEEAVCTQPGITKTTARICVVSPRRKIDPMRLILFFDQLPLGSDNSSIEDVVAPGRTIGLEPIASDTKLETVLANHDDLFIETLVQINSHNILNEYEIIKAIKEKITQHYFK